MNLETFLNGKSTETYFDEKILECKNLEELPSELTKCNCCARHKNNFPTLGSALSTYNKNKKRNRNGCECPCRHIARHLCREWDVIHEVEDIQSESDNESDNESEYDSMDDFIIEDDGFTEKERKQLDKILKKIKH